EAAKLDRVKDGGCTIEVERDAWCVAQRLYQVLSALVGDLILRHDRDRLRCCQNCRIGLGARRALAGQIAGHRTIGLCSDRGPRRWCRSVLLRRSWSALSYAAR